MYTEHLESGRRLVYVAAAAAAAAVLAAGTAHGLEIQCTAAELGIATGADTCEVCPRPEDLIRLDDASVDPGTHCTVTPACLSTLGAHSLAVRCEAGGEVAETVCDVSLVDLSAPRLACPDITVPCGEALGDRPFQTLGSSVCGFFVSTECRLQDGAGTVWNGAADGIRPASSLPYTCTAALFGRAGGQNTATCTGGITVLSATSLKIDSFPGPIPLWPPNHKMRSFSLVDDCISGVSLLDSCTGASTPVDPADLSLRIVRIESSEPEDDRLDAGSGLQGDGRTCNDMSILGEQFQLRAERDGRGTGRMYVVHYEVRFSGGGDLSANGTCRLAVPHSVKGTVSAPAECRSCVGEACPCPDPDPVCGP